MKQPLRTLPDTCMPDQSMASYPTLLTALPDELLLRIFSFLTDDTLEENGYAEPDRFSVSRRVCNISTEAFFKGRELTARYSLGKVYYSR